MNPLSLHLPYAHVAKLVNVAVSEAVVARLVSSSLTVGNKHFKYPL